MHLLGRFFTYDVAVSAGQHVVELGPIAGFVTHPIWARWWQISVSA